MTTQVKPISAARIPGLMGATDYMRVQTILLKEFGAIAEDDPVQLDRRCMMVAVEMAKREGRPTTTQAIATELDFFRNMTPAEADKFSAEVGKALAPHIMKEAQKRAKLKKGK